MINKKNSESPGYKIGAVSRMTGIAPDTLRIWERRYDIVTPERTPAGGRLYSQDQITRLTLIKNLVDAGDSISSVASLSLEDLQNRLTGTMQSKAGLAEKIDGQVCHLAILGETLMVTIKDAVEKMPDLEIVGSFTDATSFEREIRLLKPQVLLVEIPTLHEDSANQIIEWMQHSGALHVILVYRFGNTESLRRLPKSRCFILQAPVNPDVILHHCQSLMATFNQAHSLDSSVFNSELATPRRYNDETLARVATQSATIKCECPRHLTELITSLAAFERYSTECESRSPEDAMLHTYLNNTASHARAMIEDALTKVIEAENIKI